MCKIEKLFGESNMNLNIHFLIALLIWLHDIPHHYILYHAFFCILCLHTLRYCCSFLCYFVKVLLSQLMSLFHGFVRVTWLYLFCDDVWWLMYWIRWCDDDDVKILFWFHRVIYYMMIYVYIYIYIVPRMNVSYAIFWGLSSCEKEVCQPFCASNAKMNAGNPVFLWVS